LISRCNKKELGQTGLPRVRTIEVEMVSDTGVAFKGEVIDLPEECMILDYGFAWSETKNATYSFEKISLGSNLQKGMFKGYSNRAMIEGHKYYFKAFVKTNLATVFGTELSFVSLGSKAPFISNIIPGSCSWGDTIIIRGKYFSNNASLMNILIGGNTCNYDNIDNLSDTVVKIIIPYSIDTTINTVSVKYGNMVYPSAKIFTLNPNVKIISMSPSTGTWNSVVKLHGQHLSFSQGVYFDNTLAQTTSKSDSLIEIKVPYNLVSSDVDVYVKVNSFKFHSPVKYTFIPGKISAITPDTGTVGSLVTIKCNNLRTSTAKVSMLNTNLTITSRTDTSLIVQLPQFNKSGSYAFTLTDGDSQITYGSTFYYKIPEIYSLSTATYGDTLVVYGNNFDLFKSWKLSFGTAEYVSENLSVIEIKEDYLKTIVPIDHSYSYDKLHIEAGVYKCPTTLTYSIPAPVVESITSPNFPDTKFTIKGKYMPSSNTAITIMETGSVVNINSRDRFNIECGMPASFRGVFSLKVSVPGAPYYTCSKCITWNSPITLYYQDPVQRDVWGNFVKGTDDHTAFAIESNLKSQFTYNHDLKRVDTVYNVLPKMTNWASFNIGSDRYLCTGLANNTYVSAFYKLDPQSRILTKLNDFPGAPRANAGAFTFNNKGYIVGGSNATDLWEYDPSTQNWTFKVSFNFDPGVRTYSLVYNDVVFIFNKFKVWKYNPTTNVITSLSDSPIPDRDYNTPAPLTINGTKMYFKLGFYYDECWEYNITSDSWKFIFNYPRRSYGDSPYYNYYINGKGYSVFSTYVYPNYQFSVIEFDPTYLQ
jgi:hypothetical protein